MAPTNPVTVSYDVFISHATEDKDSFVRPLAEELRRAGLRVWYDEWTFKLGDSLRQKIEEGLTTAEYGIVVLSHSFFAKNWTQAELNGLFAREIRGRKVILPVRHGLTQEDIVKYSPMLADKLAALTERGVPAVAKEILDVVRPSASVSTIATPPFTINKSISPIPPEDILFYKELVELTVVMCKLKQWPEFVSEICQEPPEWDGKWADDLQRFIAEIRRTVWPKTIPTLEAAILGVAYNAASAFEILSEHVHYKNGKYLGRAFYKDIGHNPNYDRDLKLFSAWIDEYNDSMANFVKSLNWFSDAVRESLDRTFFRNEGYFTLDHNQQPPKFTPDEINELMAELVHQM